MGKKAKREATQAVALPFDEELQTEAAYYARRCGITTEEALRIIKEANVQKQPFRPELEQFNRSTVVG
ncbi:hypothetical protein [Mesorhizobium sp. B2-4-6]|uniref:hypothetical protein n=1 Tax=Mesorhizobium sp. B2-4-6 TaxID=2589943 RepID=UPI001FED8B1E|nr:hypothetical protein [Mesorhizobium sp. B2-4-6]